MRCNAARRAERQLHARRDRQPGGEFAGALRDHGLDLGLGVVVRRDDQVLDHFGVFRLYQRGIDRYRTHVALAIQRHLDEAAARLAAHL
jgi:hypothetical protein